MLSLSQRVAYFSFIKSSFGRNIQAARAMSLVRNQAFINGKWTSASDNKVFDVSNPATLKVIASVPDMTKSDCQRAIDAAHDAFYRKNWYNSTAKERSTLLKVTKKIASSGKINKSFAFLEMVRSPRRKQTRNCRNYDGRVGQAFS